LLVFPWSPFTTGHIEKDTEKNYCWFLKKVGMARTVTISCVKNFPVTFPNIITSGSMSSTRKQKGLRKASKDHLRQDQAQRAMGSRAEKNTPVSNNHRHLFCQSISRETYHSPSWCTSQSQHV
jgi:hypothetical protein